MATSARTLEVVAPLSGVIVPLEQVPDPVFARKMVGEGVAIDPTAGDVVAPVAGRVSQLHAAHHALAITSPDGLEVLVHVGLDTVTLEGRGFTPLVEPGARVERGQPVLRLDLDTIARGARSLLSEVVITNPDRVARLAAAEGLAEAGRTVLLRVELRDEDGVAEPAAAGGTPVLSAPVALPHRAGLHARPAAVLAGAAKEFASTVRLVRGEDEVNAKSVVAILGLSTRPGETVRVKATGADARAAVERLAALLAAGCGEEVAAGPEAAPPPPRVSPPRGPSSRRELSGVPASPGVAIGRVVQHRHAEVAVPETGGTPDEEGAKLDTAIREAARQLDALKRNTGDPLKAQFLDVQLALLEDPDLLEPVEELIAQGKGAAFAWREAYTRHAARLEALDNPLLRERAADLRDAGGRLLFLLSGAKPSRVEVPEGSILVADELTPTETAAFDKARVAGFCTTTGGSTSHVAILARSLGIPAVCGIEEAALALPDGTRVIVDGTHGFLRASPDEGQLAEAKLHIARLEARREEDQAAAFRLGQTRDGHRVEVAANIRNLDDAREAMVAGAEGVGLLRSEFLFAGRDSAPTEDEQAAAYGAMADVIGKHRPFVIRTLDVGGDKPLSYLPIPKEPNPFLGMRGIRVSLDHPDLFRAQLRAILRAAPFGDVHVMFPMVATLDEVRAAKRFLAEEQAQIRHAIKVGIMIEVPSAAVAAEVLAREVDFFSIGTNDLTQYTLAMDRGHPKLAKHADALHPAVLRMIPPTVEGGHEHGKWVGVCGGLAADPLAVPLLVGLGVDELSVPASTVASVKATLLRWTLPECHALATEALRLRTTAEVRSLLGRGLETPEAPAPKRATP